MMTNNSGKIKWTESQEKAINQSGALLVSASAGSGKTTVMIQRIMEYLRGGGRLRRLVVLTFSKASAADMKEKLIEQIYAGIRAHDNYSEHLKNELKDMPFALICTIDSFCYEIYNRYFEKIDGESGISMLEPEEAELMFMQNCMDVAEQSLADDVPGFAELYTAFRTNRNYDGYYIAMKDVKSYLDVRDDPDAFINKAAEIVKCEPEASPAIKYIKESILKKAGRLQKILTEHFTYTKSLREKFNGKTEELTLSWIEFLDRLSRCETLKQIMIVAEDYAIMPRYCANKKVSDSMLDAQAKLKRILDRVKTFRADGIVKKFFQKDETALNSYEMFMKAEERSKSFNEAFIDAFRRSKAAYDKEKRENAKADFADMEQWTLKILSIEEVGKEVASGIDRIFMDEYQDTNYLQERIISLIAGESNTFMVGDVKQSIYMFRHAEPRLFTDRYKRYSNENSDKGRNILLNDNFRSASGVLDFVNLLFKNIMTDDFGNVDYEKEAMMHAGTDYVTDEVLPPVAIAEFVVEKKETHLSEQYSLQDAEYKVDDCGAEATYVAQTIKKMVGQRFIFDKKIGKDGGMRAVEFRDIAVLVRRRKSAAKFISAFAAEGIPYIACGFAEDENTEDIELLLALLKVIDNLRQDIPLVAVMRSPLGGFSEEKLANIRKQHPENNFWEAVIAYSEQDKETAEFVSSLRRWSLLSHTESVAEVLSHIIAETGYDAFLMSTGEAERIATVNTYIGSLRGKEFASDMRKYLAYIDAGGKVTAVLPPIGGDAVVFNTMHGSKGLEYPIVFAVDLSDNTRPDKRRIFADDELGLSIKLSPASEYEDEDGDETTDADTLTICGHKAKTKANESTERMRLAYVAFTRARYHLFLSYTLRNENSEVRVPEEATSIAEWLRWVRLEGGKNGDDSSSMERYYTAALLAPMISGARAVSEPSATPTFSGGIPLDISFDYQYKGAVSASNKMSISMLNKQAFVSSDDIQENGGLGTFNRQYGTLYHEILEHIDFSVSDFESLKQAVKKMAEEGEISKEAGEADLSVFGGLAENPIFKAARSAERVLREQPFMLYLSGKEMGVADCDDKILVQGVIDLLILGEKNILVDYKFTNTSPEVAVGKYRKQVESYAFAVEKLMNIKLDERAIYVVNQDKIINL